MKGINESDGNDQEDVDKIMDLIGDKQYKEKIFKVNLPFTRTQSMDMMTNQNSE